jgi:hypothetical protein
MPMADYVKLTRDGLPVDPWLRTHARAGAVYVEPNVWMRHRL